MVALIETLEFNFRLISTSNEVLILLLNTNDRSGGAQVNKLPIPTTASKLTLG